MSYATPGPCVRLEWAPGAASDCGRPGNPMLSYATPGACVRLEWVPGAASDCGRPDRVLPESKSQKVRHSFGASVASHPIIASRFDLEDAETSASPSLRGV